MCERQCSYLNVDTSANADTDVEMRMPHFPNGPSLSMQVFSKPTFWLYLKSYLFNKTVINHICQKKYGINDRKYLTLKKELLNLVQFIFLTFKVNYFLHHMDEPISHYLSSTKFYCFVKSCFFLYSLRLQTILSFNNMIIK